MEETKGEKIMMIDEDYQAVRKVLVDTLQQLEDKRNDTLEEVAQEFDRLTIAFGETAVSFAKFVRDMKND
jgi:phosphopantothenate synthetase